MATATKKTPLVKGWSDAEDMNSRCRNSMEDLHYFAYPFQTEDEALFAVYDGHGGRQVAEVVHKELPRILKKELAAGKGDVVKALKSTFLLTDVATSKVESDGCGCTAAVCYLKRVGDERTLYSANCGDARTVLSRGFKGVRLTKDHKSSDKEEAERIISNGGFVIRQRVLGVLAITRSFGDHSFKSFVTAVPFMTTTKLKDGDLFVIVACDGLWDVVTDQQAVDLVKKEVWSGPGGSFVPEKARDVADMLKRHALKSGTMDNITVVVVFL